MEEFSRVTRLINPAEARAKHGEPGVGGGRSDERGFARRRFGAKIAADVSGRQTERSQTGDAEVREVLADAAPVLDHFFQWRGDGGGDLVVFEIGVDATVEIQHGDQ